MWTQTRMGGYAPNAPKGYRNKGVESVDLGAQRWAQYPDLPPKAEAKPQTAGCTFTKPCKLPDGVINYASSAIPTDAISEYGQLVLLGGREADATGKIPLQQISGFEDAKYDELSQTQPELGREVTIKTKNGARTRLDMLGRDADGKLSCIECKLSDTAPLTKNQKVAFPEIEESGAIVVGKGKPGFPGGTEIPPTKVEIIRPKP